MELDAASTTRESPLRTLANVIVAPAAAFATIRERPTWFIAFLGVTLLCLIGGFLQSNAAAHAMSVWYPGQVASDPRTASLSPDRVKSMTAIAVTVSRFVWLSAPIGVLIATLITALVLFVVSIVAKADAGFGRMFALAMNVGIVYGLAQLVTGLIVAARGADSFSSLLEVNAALPSLAWLAPSAAPKVLALLEQIQPFSIWSFVLLAFGLASVARVSRAVGYAGSGIVYAVGIILAVAAAK
jgi:hypothetical protein